MGANLDCLFFFHHVTIIAEHLSAMLHRRKIATPKRFIALKRLTVSTLLCELLQGRMSQTTGKPGRRREYRKRPSACIPEAKCMFVSYRLLATMAMVAATA